MSYFVTGATGFIGRHGAALVPAKVEAPPVALAAAAIEVFRSRAATPQAADPHSPWGVQTAWRMNGDAYHDVVLTDAGTPRTVRIHPHPDGMRLDFGHGPVSAAVTPSDRGMDMTLDGIRTSVALVPDEDAITVILDGVNWLLGVVDPLLPPAAALAGGDRIVSPMPGRIIAVRVAAGDSVTRGDVLLVLEAMKVQMRLTAPRDGTLSAVRAQEGDLVDDGVELVTYAPP